MTLPLLTAVAPRWEVGLASALARSDQVHVARRCADVGELLGVAAAGLGRVAVVSSDLRGLDRSVLDVLAQHQVVVLAVHPPQDEAGARTLRRWGCTHVLPADAGTAELDLALDELLHARGHRAPSSAAPVGAGVDLGDLTSRDLTSHDDARLTDLDPPGGGDDGADDDGDVGDQDASAAGGPGRAGSVVVVWGPTGSPGRTTLAVNLAAELADPLSPVVLVDADTYAASVGQHLAVLDEVPGVAAAARAADQGTLDRAALARLAPEVRPGLRVLTGLPRADRWHEVRDVALADVLQRCREVATWTVVDVAPFLEQDEELSFDTLAPRRNGATLTALEAADTVVVVGSGDPVGLQRLVRALDGLGDHSVGERLVVVTRVRPGAVGPDPGRRITDALRRFAGVEPVALVPDDRDALDDALLRGRALRELQGTPPVRYAVARLADHVAGRGEQRRARRGPRRAAASRRALR